MQRVTERRAVQLLLQPRIREVLGAFMDGRSSVSQASRRLQRDLRSVHRDVQALLSAGLLTEVGLQARAGRPIRHYQASAPAYFVPRALTPDADFGEHFERQFLTVDRLLYRALGRTFEQAIAEQGLGREWGLRLFWDGTTVQIDESYEDAELRGLLTGWQGPEVTALNGLAAGLLLPAEAEAVQIELIHLMMRLDTLFKANRLAGRGQPFAVRTVLAALTDDELRTLRP